MQSANTSRSFDHLLDPYVIRDALSYLKGRQLVAAMEAGASAVLRSDHARDLLHENKNQMNPPLRLLAAWLSRTGQPPMDFASMRAAHFISFLKPTIRAVLRSVPVGTLPTSEFIAIAESAPEGGHVVLVSLGFIATISNVAEWCSAALPYWGAPQISLRESGEAIARCLKSRPHDLVGERTIRIRNWFKDIMLGGIPNSAVNFAIAHEYAHILHVFAGEDLDNEAAEYAADRFGSSLALDAARHPLNFQGTRKLGAAGVELVLQTIRVRAKLGICRVDTGHPSADLRLKRIHATWAKVYGQRLIDFLSPFQAIFDAACAAQ